MNQSQIHPALRQTSLSTPVNSTVAQYADGPVSAYSLGQSSPSSAYQTSYYGQPPASSADERSPVPNPADPNDLKRPRACEACRQLKVKCELDDNNPSGICKRCAKANRQCIITVPSRKRQKKTDSRVAELERKIDALTATLAAKGGETDATLDPAIAHQQSSQPQAQTTFTDGWHAPSQSYPGSQSPASLLHTSGIKRKHQDGSEYYGGNTPKLSPQSHKAPPPVPQFASTHGENKQRPVGEDLPYVDVIDRNIIDVKTAYKCFDRYKTEMCKQLPVVVFTSDTTPEEIRKVKPVLFLAVVAVGCSTIKPDVQAKLLSETARIVADRATFNGEKSMELVQTIQILTIFYQPPDRYEELNFNALTHMAAVMAMDIGMGKRSKKGSLPSRKGFPDKNKTMPDPSAAETRRCWLGCYYMCTKRPLLVRWSPYADECLQVLTDAKDALPSDKYLCHIVKAQHIVENIGVEFSMDDPASVLSLTDSKTQRHLKAFEQNLIDWHRAGGDLMNNLILKHTEAIINLYMHEIAMHHDHNIDDFKPPFNTAPIEGPPDPDSLTPAHIESLTACLHSAHNAFDAFLAMDMKVVHALPTHFFVRTSYAAVAMIKLYSAVAVKGSKFASIFKTEELRVGYYLDRLIQRLQEVSAGGMSKVALKFVVIFTTLRNWHTKQLEAVTEATVGPEVKQQPAPTNHEPQDYKPGTLPPMQSQDAPQIWSPQDRARHEHNIPSNVPRSGLQMLSDAAMGPGPHMPPQTTQGHWMPPSQMNQPQMMQSMHGPGFNMIPTQYSVQIDPLTMGGYTSDDFMALGLGEDWVNFTYNQNPTSWAY